MKNAAIALLLACACFAVSPAQTGPLEVHIALSKTTILLGEPVWVEVTATNRSAQSLAVDWGVPCPDFHTRAIQIEVPDAVQGDGQPRPCGMAGDCGYGYTPPLGPGETETRRYVVFGDFRITQPGRYTIIAHKLFAYAPAPAKESIGLPKDHSTQTFDFQGLLNVLPPDPAKLLANEQALAAEAAKPAPQLPLKVPPNLDQEAYMAAVRAWSEANRKQQDDYSRHRYEIYEALADYPAAGMEPVFVAWETPPHSVGYGIQALKNLNTPAARAALARWAAPPQPGAPLPLHTDTPQGLEASKLGAQYRRAAAVDALAEMGDTTYLPLLESLTRDSSFYVRQAALFGLAKLGGASEFTLLDSIARFGPTSQDRSNAIQAMGRSGSAKAVPLLLDLFDDPPIVDPDAPGIALTMLTHHQLPATLQRSTPAAMESAWRDWWARNAGTAAIFGEYDCGPFNR